MPSRPRYQGISALNFSKLPLFQVGSRFDAETQSHLSRPRLKARPSATDFAISRNWRRISGLRMA